MSTIKWTCSACTFDNSITSKKCEICGVVKAKNKNLEASKLKRHNTGPASAKASVQTDDKKTKKPKKKSGTLNKKSGKDVAAQLENSSSIEKRRGSLPKKKTPSLVATTVPVDWKDDLQNKRSILLLIENLTTYSFLRKGTAKLTSGKWAKEPPFTIPSMTICEFGTKGKRFSGSTGNVSYSIEGNPKPFLFYWHNPKVGSIESTISEYDQDLFKIEAKQTKTEKYITVTFQLWESDKPKPEILPTLAKDGLSGSVRGGHKRNDSNVIEFDEAEIQDAANSATSRLRSKSLSGASKLPSFDDNHIDLSDSRKVSSLKSATSPSSSVVDSHAVNPFAFPSTTFSGSNSTDAKSNFNPFESTSASFTNPFENNNNNNSFSDEGDDDETASNPIRFVISDKKKEEEPIDNLFKAGSNPFSPPPPPAVGSKRSKAQPRKNSGTPSPSSSYPSSPTTSHSTLALESNHSNTNTNNINNANNKEDKQLNLNEVNIEMIKCVNKLENGNFKEGIEICDAAFELLQKLYVTCKVKRDENENKNDKQIKKEGLNFFESMTKGAVKLQDKSIKEKKLEEAINLVSNYKLCLLILLEIESEIIKVTPSNKTNTVSKDKIKETTKSIAELTFYLTLLKLHGRHASVINRMAVKYNMLCGNYEIAKTLLNWMIKFKPVDYVSLEKLVNECGSSSSSSPNKNKSEKDLIKMIKEKNGYLGFCQKSFKRISKDMEEHVIKCKTCNVGVYLEGKTSGLNSGDGCELCSIGKLAKNQ